MQTEAKRGRPAGSTTGSKGKLMTVRLNQADVEGMEICIKITGETPSAFIREAVHRLVVARRAGFGV